MFFNSSRSSTSFGKQGRLALDGQDKDPELRKWNAWSSACSCRDWVKLQAFYLLSCVNGAENRIAFSAAKMDNNFFK